MSISAESVPNFISACQQLERLGTAGCERLAICQKGELLYPVVISGPSVWERVLRFFGYKYASCRLKEVANFTLNWLRAHALMNKSMVLRQTRALNALIPLMQKAGLKEYLDRLAWNLCPELYQPNGLSDSDFKKIRDVMVTFFSNPGTEIQRLKHTNTLAVSIPCCQPYRVTLSRQVDFELSGAVDRRRIIIYQDNNRWNLLSSRGHMHYRALA